MPEPIPGRVHRHFKSAEKTYLVLGIATDVDPPFLERVVYVPLYGEFAGKFLTRTRKEWEEDVDRVLEDGSHYCGPRFWPLPDVPVRFDG